MKQKFLYTLLILILVCVGIEWVARIVFPMYADEHNYIERFVFPRLRNAAIDFASSDNYSKKFGFTLPPHATMSLTFGERQYTVKTNSSGFRTKEIQAKTDDEYRVLLVGDNMFFGEGIEEEDLLSTRLENFPRQSAHASYSLSVYNYAILGYNTVQELIVAKHYSPQIQPDHIILGFFLANDIIPNAGAFIDAQGNYTVDHTMIETMQNMVIEAFPFPLHSVVIRKFGLPVYVPRIRYSIASDASIIDRSYQLLQAFQEYTQSRKLHFSVVLIYPRDAVQGGMLARWTQSRKVGALLRDFCDKRAIEILDLLDIMDGKKAREKYFFKHSGFLNQAAHSIIAQAIYDRLVTGHLIEEEKF